MPWRAPARERRRDGAVAPGADAGAAGAADVSDAPARAALAALRGGDAAALAELYAAEAPRVYRYALAVAGNPAWAADATQEAFVALALAPDRYDPARGPIGAYLAGIARHALLAQWRRAPGAGPWPGDDDPPDGEAGAADATAPSPEQLLVRAQDGEAVWAAVARLAPAFREAVVLVDLQERPYAEAAAIAGIELNTLRTRLHRARRQLAAWLRGDGGTHP